MKKIISIIILIGILIVGGLVFLVSKKDESKMAEIPQTDQIDNKSIVDKIIENPPQLQNNNQDAMIMKAKEAMEKDAGMSGKSGTFIKIDPLHYASGDVRVEKSGENFKLVFGDNFSSAPGPDLYIYLSQPQNYKNIALGGVDTSKTLNVGKLKNQTGPQEYLVSKKDFDLYGDSVIIWCKSFNVQFSRANLK